MKKIHCIVIDDEPMAIGKLEAYISKIPFMELVASCESPVEAMPYLADGRVDAMFIDINMPDINGFDFIRSLPECPQIVFTTAYPEYAVDSYKFDATDYLLKPFDFPAFQRAANKLYKNTKASDEPHLDEDTIYVKVDYRFVAVRIADIVFVKGMNEYVQLSVDNGKPIVAYITMKQMKDRLPRYFLQIHRSYIVNMRKIKEIERKHVVLPDGERIAVTENYREAFSDFLQLHSLTKRLPPGRSQARNDGRPDR